VNYSERRKFSKSFSALACLDDQWRPGYTWAKLIRIRDPRKYLRSIRIIHSGLAEDSMFGNPLFPQFDSLQKFARDFCTMELPNLPPPSPVSPLSETATPTTRRETKISGKSRSCISCRTSTGIPRSSFVTISSQSITIFADIRDIPSRSGSQHSRLEEPNIPLRAEVLEFKSKRQSYASIESISSFGFDVAVPESVHGVGEPVAKGYVDHMRKQLPRQTSFRSVWGSKSANRKQKNFNESFPRPASKALINFATVFPEIAQDKQYVFTDKSLPPPPYHVFGSKKKKGIMYLMAIVGVLTPLSSFIYFPVLGDISRVSISQM
jgi:hypothetical protein